MLMKTHLCMLLFAATLSGCGRSGPPAPNASKEVRTPTESTLAESPVYVELPQGWRTRQPKVATVRQIADYPQLAAHFTLAIQPQADFGDDLMAWAEATKQATAEQSTLTDRRETALRQSRIGAHTVVEYEIEADSDGSPGRARVIMLPLGEWFCKVTCWTTPANWDAAQPRFEDVVTHLRNAAPHVRR